MKCRKCRKEVEKTNCAGICSNCNKLNRQKQIALNIQPGNCSICNKFVEKRDAFRRGYECGCHDNFYSNLHKSLTSKGKCTICKKEVETRDQQGRCNNCHKLWYKNHNSSEKMKQISAKSGTNNLINFMKTDKFKENSRYLEKWRKSERFRKMLKNNRKKQVENFYKNINDFIENSNINFNGKSMNLNNLEDLNDIPGVWSLWGVNIKDNIKYCLTVGQTQNLKKELQWTLRVLSNDKLQEMEKENPGCTGRWDKIQSLYENFEYFLINKGECEKQTREFIEATYAVKNKALYWLPSFTQSTKFYNQDCIDTIKAHLDDASEFKIINEYNK